jgi:RimJ/RimL family protein N-acetyltransferase
VSVTLRPATVEDIELFYRLQQDPVAVWMAAFTSAELADRSVFEARWRRVLADPSVDVRTVLVDAEAVGQVLTYRGEDGPEVSYWIDRDHWGRGHATEALRLMLAESTRRPVHARAAQDNTRSVAVLVANGFRISGEDAGLAAARGEVVKEYVLTLTD